MALAELFVLLDPIKIPTTSSYCSTTYPAFDPSIHAAPANLIHAMDKQDRSLPPTPPEPCSTPATAGPPERTSAGQFRPGTSGNPKGRTPGVFTQATVLARTLLESKAAELTNKAITEALAGNPIALKLCLERLVPVPQNRAVQVNLPEPRKPSPNSTPAEILAEHNALLRSVANGELTPQEGQSLSAIIEARRRSWEAVELHQRLNDIEDRLDEYKSGNGRSKP